MHYDWNRKMCEDGGAVGGVEAALQRVWHQSFVDDAASPDLLAHPDGSRQPNQFVLFYNANLINKKEKKSLKKFKTQEFVYCWSRDSSFASLRFSSFARCHCFLNQFIGLLRTSFWSQLIDLLRTSGLYLEIVTKRTARAVILVNSRTAFKSTQLSMLFCSSTALSKKQPFTLSTKFQAIMRSPMATSEMSASTSVDASLGILVLVDFGKTSIPRRNTQIDTRIANFENFFISMTANGSQRQQMTRATQIEFNAREFWDFSRLFVTTWWIYFLAFCFLRTSLAIISFWRRFRSMTRWWSLSASSCFDETTS